MLKLDFSFSTCLLPTPTRKGTSNALKSTKTMFKSSPLVSWEHELCPTLPVLRSVSQFGEIEANHLAWCWEPHPHWISDASGSVCHQERQWEGLGKPGTPAPNARQDMIRIHTTFKFTKCKQIYFRSHILNLPCGVSSRFQPYSGEICTFFPKYGRQITLDEYR